MNTILHYSGVTDLCQGAKDLYNGNFRSAALNTVTGAAKGICTMGVIATTVYLAREILSSTKCQDRVVKPCQDQLLEKLKLSETAHIEIFCERAVGRDKNFDFLGFGKDYIGHCRESFRDSFLAYKSDEDTLERLTINHPSASCNSIGECSKNLLPPQFPYSFVFHISKNVQASLDAGAKVRDYCVDTQNRDFTKCLATLAKKASETAKSPLHELFKLS